MCTFLNVINLIYFLRLKRVQVQLNSKKENTNFIISEIQRSERNQKIFCSLHLNYFERPKKREIKLIGEKGKIDCDLVKNEIKIFKGKNLKTIKYKINRNEIFKNQIRYFLKCVKSNKKIRSDFDVINGIKSLKIALKLK